MLTPLSDILPALRDHLGTLNRPNTTTAEPLFQDVLVYDSPDLLDALHDLLSFASRVALIVPADESWEPLGPSAPGTPERRARTLAFTVILADTHHNPSQNPLLDNPATQHPGLLNLAEWTTAHLAYVDLGLPHIHLVPVRGGPQEITSDDNPNRTRRAWLQRYETFAGTMAGMR